MKNAKKIALITAGCLILVGLIMVLGGLAALGFDVTRFNTVSYETGTYEIEEPFYSISIDGGSSDVRLYPSQYDTCRVVCTEGSDVTFDVAVSDGTLTIRRQSSDIRFLYFGVYFGETGISVYLPEQAYESLTIRTTDGDVTVSEALTFASADLQTGSGAILTLAGVKDTLSVQAQSGDIHMGNLSPKSLTVQSTSGEISLDHVKGETALQIRSSSGDVSLANIQAKALDASAASGSISLRNVILDGEMNLESLSGDVGLHTSDAAGLQIQTTSGSVGGTLLSEKIFLIDTASGDVNVPHSASGGTCEVTTQSGDVDFQIVTNE